MPRRRPHRFVTAIICVAAVALATTGPVAARSPVDPLNRPTPLLGRVNGEVPAGELVNVTPTCRAARAAAPSLRLLFSLARYVGVALDAEECYRPLDLQVVARASATANGNAACAASVGTSSNGKPVGRSMHGWGKAADMVDAAGSLTFSSAGYRFLKATAARVGWNHGAWSEPGGGPCPEPWHWEWVGDGGVLGLDSLRADIVGLVAAPDDRGYGVVTGLGAIAVRGSAADHGSMVAVPINWLVVGAAATPSRRGYWMVASDGGVFGFGDAAFHGSLGNVTLNQPILGMAPTPSGKGYWLVASDGGIFSFGDAAFHGSTGAIRLVRPVTAMAPTPSGKGYWLVASDGGVFSFGDAAFHGSLGNVTLNQPILGMAPTPSGRGYWLVASDGGVFSFGDARFFGAATASGMTAPVVGIVATASGHGYWTVTASGDVSAFGDAPFVGNG